MQTAGKDATVRRLMNENSTLMDENSILRAEIERLRASNKEQRGQTTLALDLVSTRNREIERLRVEAAEGQEEIRRLRLW
jgi:predicted RNase H-like nuclease (RuvC/YqgF family)